MKYLLIIAVAVFLSFVPVNVYPQGQEGLGFYQNGDYKKAADAFSKALRTNSSDPVLWNYLGLSLDKTGDLKGAKSAFEKAIRINPSFSAYHSNITFVLIKLEKFGDAKDSATRAIDLDPKNSLDYYFRSVAYLNLGNADSALKDARLAILNDDKFAAAYLVESKVLLVQLSHKWDGNESEEFYSTIKDSIASLEKCLENCDGDLADVHRELEIIRALNEFLKLNEVDPKTNSFPAAADDGKESMKVLNRSSPKYTTKARNNQISGTVRLAVVFCSDGVIGPIIVLQGLPHGLTESSIEAAGRVKFKPEMRDGKPVTVVKTVAFNFGVIPPDPPKKEQIYLYPTTQPENR